MNTIELIKQSREELDMANAVLKQAESDFEEQINKININEFSALSYEECKDVFDMISYRIERELYTTLDGIVQNKKVELHPEGLKAVYFKDINKMNITDEEKVKLDRYLKNHNGHAFRKQIDSEMDDMIDKYFEPLMKLGIVEKYYRFTCEECGNDMFNTLTQTELNAYIKAWNGEEMEEEENDMVEYGTELCLYCEECDYKITIISKEEFDDLYKTEYYKLIQKPDLTYDEL